MDNKAGLELSEIEVMTYCRCSTNDQTFIDGSFELDYNSFIYDTDIENYNECIDEPNHYQQVPSLKTKTRLDNGAIISNRNDNAKLHLNTNLNTNTNCNSECTDSSLISNGNRMTFASNKIVIENIILGEDQRTTVLIKDIPVDFDYDIMLNDIKAKFKGKYNQLSIEKSTKSSKGFVCINFSNPFHVILFYELYHNKSFSKKNYYSGGDKLKLCYYSNTTNVYTPFKHLTAEPSNASHHANNTINTNTNVNTQVITSSKIEIPIKYKSLFKRIYSCSVCIDINDHWYNEKLFYVKRLGIKKQSLYKLL